MNLEDALGGWPNQPQGGGGGGAWPGQQPPNPTWPGQPSGPGGWPGAPTGPGQPSGPGGWPSAPSGPSQPSGPGGWPGAPTGPGQPSGPGGWPSAPSGPSQPSGPGGWPSAPSGPTQPSGPSGPSGPGWPSPAPGPTAPSFPVAPQMNLMLPLSHPVPYGLENKTISIRGTVKRNAKMFTIDFCRASDIAFHFNPRFNEGGQKVVVRNSMVGQKWGKEERDGHFPFTAGQNFDMKVEVTRSGFKVTANGQHLPEFRHRNVNPRDIKQIGVFNDITLSHFSVD